MRLFRTLCLGLIGSVSAALSLAQSVHAQDDIADALGDLVGYSLEDLLTLESTSVAKKRQQISESAAAVFVLTQDDIRRSGATNIPELLRMVPGVEVGQINGSATALSVRGGNTRFSNNLLVMVDGRSIYVSTLSGVYWDQQIVPLSQIERIEVVRGPGATVWGSNAVNGVINIITKSSLDTQGLQLSGQAGNQEQIATLGYGGNSGDKLTYRVYATGQRRDNFEFENGDDLPGNWEAGQLGFRLDYAPNAQDVFTLQGDVQVGSFIASQVFSAQPGMQAGFLPAEGAFDGQNILGRWARRLSDDLEFTVQGYVDRVAREEFDAAYTRTMVDLESSVRWRANARHELVFGLGARGVWDKEVESAEFIEFSNPRLSDQWVSGFVQDDIWLLQNVLKLSIGTKLEYNTVSGTELQPSVRMLWHPTPNTTFWAAFSKANRIPATFEQIADLSIGVLPFSFDNPGPLPINFELSGNPDLQSVRLYAWEGGFRGKLFGDWHLDITGYHNDYERVIAYDFAGQRFTGFLPGGIPTGIEISQIINNSGSAKGSGIEVALNGNITSNWKIKSAYTFADYDITVPPGSVALAGDGTSPSHQFSLRSQWDFSDRWELDAWFRHVSGIEQIPSYEDLDLRLNYRFSDHVDIGLVGQNLLQARRPEFTQGAYPGPINFVPRAFSATLSIRY